jgi:hypothetical protein
MCFDVAMLLLFGIRAGELPILHLEILSFHERARVSGTKITVLVIPI